MLIAIDLDGVVYPLHEITRDWLVENEYIPKGTSVKSAFKFLENKSALFIDDLFDLPVLYERRLPNTHIVNSIERILEEGNEILYLTNRSEKVIGVTIRYLRNLPASSAVFFTNNKQQFCRENGVDVIFDDRDFNLTGYEKTLPVCVQSFEHPKVIEPRFRDIWEAYQFAKQHYKEV